jgi:DNA-binding FadR family transcriptional regulator
MAVAVSIQVPAPRAGADDAEELIHAQVMAARVACKQITGSSLQLLLDSVDRACCLPARPGWEQKSAAHAEIFTLLADVAGGHAAAARYGRHARLIDDLMRAVGPAANGMIASSRRRLLMRLRYRDADGAALEMENHLRALHYMWRLARSAPR